MGSIKCIMPRSLKIKPDCIDKVKLTVRRNDFPRQRSLPEELEFALLPSRKKIAHNRFTILQTISPI